MFFLIEMFNKNNKLSKFNRKIKYDNVFENKQFLNTEDSLMCKQKLQKVNE